jgi:hypothetical protein
MPQADGEVVPKGKLFTIPQSPQAVPAPFTQGSLLLSSLAVVCENNTDKIDIHAIFTAYK